MARLAVVSGGGSGIGKAIARALAEDGDQVVILGRRGDVLKQSAEEINEAAGGERVTVRRADLTQPDDVARVAATIEGPVDVLVNNAGGRLHGGASDDADLTKIAGAWREHYNVNVLPTVLLTRALRGHLRRPGGRVIAIGSNAALLGRGAYGAAKAALHAWAYGLVPELAADGITVNVVAPGMALDAASPRFVRNAEQARQLVPMGRFGTHEEMAGAVRYLASPQAGYVTGQILQVNGGMVLGRG
ncbi:SDR family NAD(P)-dependent oxidoreductase [Spongiactinospora sp. 9N601]|uniref:SDR family NAD(P)-dependent oxidoreductase n=1 Tax=Spongiactinospora sp. 9N601 TaxID=3375149 RepID=UPI0037AC3083